jgi:hypothetical protein
MFPFPDVVDLLADELRRSVDSGANRAPLASKRRASAL